MPQVRKQYFDNSLQQPIFQTATYFFQNTREVISYHKKESMLGRYSRYDNPNCLLAEEQLARLDKCEAALLFTSGMTAIAMTALALLKHGDRVFYTGAGYRNIRNLFSDVLMNMGIDAVPLRPFNGDSAYIELEKLFDRRCKMLFIESPSNPHMYLADVPRLRSIVGKDTLIIVDSTLATPVNYLPITHGADLIIHSCGKYIGGHADIMAGSVAGDAANIEKIRRVRNVVGGIVDPHTASLVSRSLSTLPLRMSKLNTSGIAVAQGLRSIPGIEFVYHTSLPSHPNYDFACSNLKGHGGIVTFELSGNMEFTSQFIDEVTIPYLGTNFGCHVSMIEQPRIFSYYSSSAIECDELGIADSLVRLSIGFSDEPEALLDDIRSALIRAAERCSQVSTRLGPSE